MGLRVDPDKARRVLNEAYNMAVAAQRLPGEWLERAERIGESPSKTYVAALGTALLARATEPRIDPLSIKERSGKRGYSVRTLGHRVLVPASVEYGFDLGATGREPLNNQPFFGNDRMDRSIVVHARSRGHWDYLIDSCERIDRLSATKAKAALAAFIRQRLAAAAAAQTLNLAARQFRLEAIADTTTQFIHEDPEGGKRGQACTAAALDLAFPTVRMGRINDPSVRFPGDVQVLDGVRVVMPVEVRQKRVTAGEVRQFAAAVARAGVDRAMIAALHPNQEPLPRHDLLKNIEERHGVTMSAVESVEELLGMVAFVSPSEPIDSLLGRFPERMLARLQEIEASQAARIRWVRLAG